MPSDVTLRPGRGPYPARFGNLSTDLILSTANSLDEKAPGGISPGGTIASYTRRVSLLTVSLTPVSLAW